MALTGKKQKFADAVLAGLSNKKAAIAAGYSEATAAQAGSRLVKDKDVAAYLAKRRPAPADAASAPAAPAAPAPSAPTFDLAAALTHADPKTFLLAAMNDFALDPRQRIDAAKALMPFTHQKLGEGGKKEQKKEGAEVAAKGRFGAPPPPPRLVSGGSK